MSVGLFKRKDVPYPVNKTKKILRVAGVNAYRNSMQLAVDHGIRTIAFPSISTGVYSYPLEEAAEIAVRTVKEFYKEHIDDLDYVRFVLFDPKTRKAYDNAIVKLGMKGE